MRVFYEVTFATCFLILMYLNLTVCLIIMFRRLK